MATISIIGTGLIGSSMGLDLRRAGYFVIGCDSNAQNLEDAKRIGAVDATCQSISMAVAKTQVVILAIPVNRIIDILPIVLDNIPENGVVIDTGSTKGAICHSIANHQKRSAFVAAHPMAGSEQSGPMAATQNLFAGRRVAICEHEKSSEQALEKGCSIFIQLGMQIVRLSPTEHDSTVAMVSHLPQIMAYAYAGMIGLQSADMPSWSKLASSGFDSVTRLSSSSADVWLPIILQNKEAVTNSIDSLVSMLTDVARNIHDNNQLALCNIIESARNTRSKFQLSQSTQPEKV